jgi:hypothetical protein
VFLASSLLILLALVTSIAGYIHLTFHHNRHIEKFLVKNQFFLYKWIKDIIYRYSSFTDQRNPVMNTVLELVRIKKCCRAASFLCCFSTA